MSPLLSPLSFAVQVAKTALAVAAAVCLASPLAQAQNRANYSLASAAADILERESNAAGETRSETRPETRWGRQVTSTRLGSSLPNGLDIQLKRGLYLGAWGSGIRWDKQNNLGGVLGHSVASSELDIYAGFRTEISKKVWLDVGVQRFANGVGGGSGGVGGLGHRADLFAGQALASQNEVYGALTWGLLTAKYSRNLDNAFGSGLSAGLGGGAARVASQYIDLSANFDLGNGYSLAPRIGKQDFASPNPLAFTDYSLTLGKTFANGLSLTVTALGTQAGQSLYVLPGSEFTGRIGLAAGLKYAF